MPTTFHLRAWTRFFDPIDRVWQVKTSRECLLREFPGWAPLRVEDEQRLQAAFDRAEPVEVQARLGLLPWPLRLELIEPGRRFVDSSENSLFESWHHEHLFEETSDGCRYIDAVTFRPRLPASKLAAVLTERFFIGRHKAAAPLLNADPRTIGVTVLRVHQPGLDNSEFTTDTGDAPGH